MADQYITVREAAQTLSVSEKKIMDLIDERKLQAYRIAGQFLRLKKNEILEIRNTGHVTQDTVRFDYTKSERLRDFFYFNDFYIISIVIVLALISVIFYF